jgi:hypothetical protein
LDDTNGHEAGQDDTALRRARVQHLLQEAQSLLLEAGARSASVYLERAMACIDVDVADDPTQIAVAAAIMPGESALRRAMGGALTIVGTYWHATISSHSTNSASCSRCSAMCQR